MHQQQVPNDFIQSGCDAYNSGQYVKAGRMFILALRKARQDNSKGETICMIRFNLGLFYCQQKRYKKAERCFLSALTICHEQGDRDSELRVLLQLAELYSRWDKPRRASRMYKAILSEPQFVESLSVLDKDNVYSKVFKLFYTQGNYSRAAMICQEALQAVSTQEDTKPLATRWSVFRERCIDMQRGRRRNDGTVVVDNVRSLDFSPPSS